MFLTLSRLAGSTGTIITCPLEVIKTRLQSDISSLNRVATTTTTTTTITTTASQALTKCNATQPVTAAPTPANSATTLNNLNRIQFKFGSQLAHNYSTNSTRLFRNNHVNQPASLHYGNLGTNMNLVNNINTSSKSLQPRMGPNIFHHLK